MRKNKSVKKIHLPVLLSVCSGYLMSTGKNPQDDYEKCIEFITSEDVTKVPIRFLARISKIYLEGLYPELLEKDLKKLIFILEEKSDRTKDERFKSWIKNCYDKGMKKIYRVKPMTTKQFSQIMSALTSNKVD